MKLTAMVFFLLCLITAMFAEAQPITRSDAQWENLKRLKQGKKIYVDAFLAGEIKGKYLGVEGENLYIEHHKRQIRLKRENIRSVFVPGKSNWSSSTAGAVIGFAIGAAYGNYMVYAVGEGYSDLGDHAKGTVLFGGIGAVCGWITGKRLDDPTRPIPIYEAEW